ncbi:hypothetical protein PR202_gb13964 [Eleusine coracana subsp. coracana]|uniref:Lunapark domain-containing protein n=1 Tax=Eleusine coracana subsp. coracana TaxID=191504 RepID=A0AAV5EU21_ELECO|nr:hypothetical protein PR202_gb13964 [Eleusine coracana subsp. coracana]
MAEGEPPRRWPRRPLDRQPPPETPATQTRRQRGLVSRVWKGIFGGREDVEKLLQALSKEEETVRTRLRRRARASRQSAHNVLALAGTLEIAAVGYAIMTTRSPDLSWQMRAARVLPMFLIPALAALIYSTITSLTKMLDNRDQHTLEKLRAERQAKIDELKEKTNYYMTQQLIQRYDLDPAAKAAAASVLASKLGADSGLRVFVGDDSGRDATLGKSNENNIGQTAGLRQRKPGRLSNVTGQTHSPEPLDASNVYDFNEEGLGTPDQRSVEHFRGPAGLSRKEDFAFITYYCPHCNALNGSRQHDDQELVSNSVKESPSPRSDGSVGPNFGKESPHSHSDSTIDHAGASLASSSIASPVVSSLRTVEEHPAEDSVEEASCDQPAN